MNKYSDPNPKKLMEELRRAGAGENGQIAGALWITSALNGIALPKATAQDADRLRKIQRHLEAAAALIEDAPEPWPAWLADDVTEPVKRSSQAIKFVLNGNPGGQRQRKHLEFAETLRRYFESEGLNVALSEGAPFVNVFAEAIGMEPETARTTLRRLS